MDIQKLSRKEKEELCIKKMNELQSVLKKPPLENNSAEIVKLLNEEKIIEMIIENTNRIRTEKFVLLMGGFFKLAIIIFVSLGIIGLLIFGIKQLF